MLPSSLFLGGTRGWILAIGYGTRLYWIGVVLLVVFLVAALIKGYREWQEIHDVEEPDTPDDLLRSFREAHALGELDDEEFQRVQRRLSASSAPVGPPAEVDDRARSRPEQQPTSLDHRDPGPSAAAPQEQPAPADHDRPAGRDGT